MLKKFITPSGILALCTAFAVVWLAINVPMIVNNQLTSIQANVKLEVSQTRKEVLGTVNDNFEKLFGLTNSAIEKTDTRLSSIQHDTFQTLGEIKSESLARLDTFSTNTNTKVSSTSESVNKLLDAYTKIPEIVGARLDKQTDCAKNGLCWQNLTTDTLVQTRYAARDLGLASQTFKAEFPKLIGDSRIVTDSLAITIPKIGTSVANTADNIDKLTHPHWYDRLLGYAVNGAILYRQLNPATIAVQAVTGAISSQK